MSIEKTPDFLVFQAKFKDRINELFKKKHTEKMNFCFLHYPENFEDYSKCFYSFERVINEKIKYMEFSQSFFEKHYEKCKGNKDRNEMLICLKNLSSLSSTIYESLENEIKSIK